LLEKNSGLLELKGINGRTPIFLAVTGDHVEIVELLINKGANLNALDKNKRNCLHLACYGRDEKIIQMLIKGGIDINALDEMGHKPYDFAVLTNNDNIIAMLKSSGGTPTTIKDPEIFTLTNYIYRVVFPFHMRSNIGVSSGPDGVLLIDTGFGPQTVNKLRETIKSRGSGEIRYILNTHNHSDHTAGNSIRVNNTVFINFNNLKELESEDILTFYQKNEQKEPKKTFENFYSMWFNGDEVRIIPYPGVHSNQDLITYFYSSGIVHMGDLLLSESFPAVGENVDEYMELLGKILDYFPKKTIFISGHGRELSMKEMKEYMEMLSTTITIVTKEIKAGKELDVIKEENVLKEYDSYNKLLPFLDTNYWINAIWRSYYSK